MGDRQPTWRTSRATNSRGGLTAMDAATVRHVGRRGLPTIADEEGRIFPASRNALRWPRCCAALPGARRGSVGLARRAHSGGRGRRHRRAGGPAPDHGQRGDPGAVAPIETSSDGSGLQLAASLGHPVTALQPGRGLARHAWAGRGAAGLALPAVSVTLVQQGRCGHTGDLLLRSMVSGPVIHNLSLLLAPRCAVQARLRLLASQGLEVEQARRLAADAGHSPGTACWCPTCPAAATPSGGGSMCDWAPGARSARSHRRAC